MNIDPTVIYIVPMSSLGAYLDSVVRPAAQAQHDFLTGVFPGSLSLSVLPLRSPSSLSPSIVRSRLPTFSARLLPPSPLLGSFPIDSGSETTSFSSLRRCSSSAGRGVLHRMESENAWMQKEMRLIEEKAACGG